MKNTLTNIGIVIVVGLMILGSLNNGVTPHRGSGTSIGITEILFFGAILAGIGGYIMNKINEHNSKESDEDKFMKGLLNR